MAARVQVIVEAQDASSGILRAITAQFGALGGVVEELTAKNVSWGNVAERAATMVIDGLKASLEATTKYAEAVRDQSLASGQSAEASSRFLQVLDDYQLAAEDAKTATRALTKEGLAPTVETLIKLSSEYQQLSTAEEKNAFVQEHLGRSGQAWLNLLDQGPDKIRAMNAAVSESLILTEKDIQAAEKYRLALDDWNDSLDAAKISIGTELLPALTGLMQNTKAGSEAVRENVRSWEYLVPIVGSVHGTIVALTAAQKENGEATDAEVFNRNLAGRSMAEYDVATQKATEDLKELEQVNAQSINAVIALTEANDAYSEKQDEVTAKIEALRAEKAKLYPWEKTKLQEIDGQIDELNASYQKNAEEFRKAMNKKLASMALEKIAMSDGVAGFNAAEMKKAQAILTTLDVATRSAFEEQLAMQMITEAVATNQISVEQYGEILDKVMSDGVMSIAEVKAALNSLPQNVTTTYSIITTGAPPTTGVTYPSSGGGLCFVENTYVYMSDGSQKWIQDIEPGDLVLSYDLENETKVPAVVECVFQHTSEEMSDGYYLLINGSIGVTLEHPFYVCGEWIRAGDLKAGDKLLGVDGSPVVVEKIELKYHQVKTYNLEVEHHHNYFAAGVLVHNKLQSGGVAYAGVPTMVGEGGPEPFFPAVGGRVIGHAEALHALTLGGAGGNNMYFYGSVSIEAGSNAGGDLLSIR